MLSRVTAKNVGDVFETQCSYIRFVVIRNENLAIKFHRMSEQTRQRHCSKLVRQISI